MGIAAKSVDLSILGTKVGRPESLDVSFTSTQSAELLYLPDAINFNGSNSHIQYANNLFSDVDLDYEATGTHTKAMTMSFWIKPAFSPNQVQYLTHIEDTVGEQTEISFVVDSSSNITFGFAHSHMSTLALRASDRIRFVTTNAVTNNAWNHVVYSTKVELSSGSETWTHRLRINGTDYDSSITDEATMDATIDTTADSYFGRKTDGTLRYNGCLTEFFLDDQFYDLDTTSELRKFYSATSKPVNPPTANKLVHLTGNATTWTNKGTTALGTQTLSNITDCADSPSD
jgi:hypothetical protein